MRESAAKKDDPVVAFDGRQSEIAAELQRGVCRAFRALGLSVVTELAAGQWAPRRRGRAVAGGRRADRRDQILPARLPDRRKWQDYLAFCDRLYFAVSADFPREVIPHEAGLILADRYGAELVREGLMERLTAARRKAMMLCFARAAALRLQRHLDPACGFEL